MGASIIESRIHSVALYRRGARVTRTVELPAERPDQLAIGPLPLGLRDGSVRVAVLGEGAVPRATDVALTLAVPEPDEGLPEAHPEQLRAAELAVRTLEVRSARVDVERARMQQLGVVSRPEGRPGRPPPPSPLEARLAVLELRAARLAELDEESAALASELRAARKTLSDLSAREHRASTARRAEAHELRKTALVTLRGEGGPARLELSYEVDAARWAPSYVLRMDAALQTGRLELRASVAQRSGEDWDRVALRLSTASMRGWAELPELRALRIGRRVPTPEKRGWRPPPVGTDALFADFDRAAAPPPKSAPPPAPPAEEPMPMPQAPPPPMQSAPPGAMPAAGAAPSPKVKRRREESVMEAAAQSVTLAAPMVEPVSRSAAAPRSSGGLLGAVGGAFGGAAGVIGDLLSADASALMESDDSPASYGGGGPSGRADAEVDDGVGDPRALLDYGRLRMPNAKHARRGRLELVSRRAIHLEYVEEQRLEIDVEAAFSSAASEARALARSALPPGLCPVAPSGHDYVYRADARLDAASDGAFHSLAISEHEVRAEARFVVVPRESRDVFRYLEIDNPLDAPLLDGPIDVYVGDDFLLATHLSEVAAGGTMRLGLGVEQRIKVARNTRYDEKTGGMLGGRLDLRHTIEVEVENRLTREAAVEVRERVPVLREDEDDITVREVSAEPSWRAWEPDDAEAASVAELRGGHRWRVKIPPGEKQTLTASYTVRIASKNELVGGNRRER